jgi:DNA-binding response OmpR family regulator
VDDELSIASTLTTILELNGYDARCFVNPLEALEAASTVRPDLLISDVVMPELSGIDLAIRFRQQWPTCKVLLFSGQAIAIDLLQAARTQGEEFQLLEKPIHPTDLLARIKDEIDA